jgi:hypothetical protein
MSVRPEARPRSFARAGFMNHARPRPEATAQQESLQAASSTETQHISATCGPAGSVGSTNCGRNAVKNASVYGLDSATVNPRQKCMRLRIGATTVLPALRHAWTPIHTR